MNYRVRLIFPLAGFCCFLSSAFAQAPASVEPARVVLIFRVSPSEFSSLKLDEQSFASLSVPGDRATAWSAPPGTRVLRVTAPQAQDRDLKLQLGSGRTTLVMLGLRPTPGSQSPDVPAKQVTAAVTDLPLPPLGRKSQLFYYLAPGNTEFQGLLSSGSMRGAKTAKVQVVPGKLMPLGETESVLSIDGRELLRVEPGSPGVFVYILDRDSKGQLKTYPLSLFAE
jgi:hypothetical protein